MKKLLSLLLCATLLLTVIPAYAAEDITVYVSVSKYGEFVEDENGQKIAATPITLSSGCTLDDVFRETHSLYCPEGYLSAEGEFGTYITMLWGDESGNFGYQINGGEVFVSSLSHPVENGDYIDAAIYRNYYPDTESYTKFTNYTENNYVGKPLILNLKRAGYDENWNTVFSPCEGALITINGEMTEIVTDAEGNAEITFDLPGTYIISATKSKTVGESEVPDITAPVCIVTAEEFHAVVLHTLAEKYFGEGVSSDENMHWFLADLSAYSSLFPEKELSLSKKEKQACIDKMIKEADKTKQPSYLAKTIIALRAMGFDASKAYNSSSKKINLPEKLLSMIEDNPEAAKSLYTLPYVIIALNQMEGYATEEQLKSLTDYAVSIKAQWIENEWGPDAAAAMVLALVPFAENDESIALAVEEGTEAILSAENLNAASCGLSVAALSAVNEDRSEFIDRLMTFWLEDSLLFKPDTNSFSTEQAFRGLIANLLAEEGKVLYDFSDLPAETVKSTKKVISSGGGSVSSSISKPKDEPVSKPETEPEKKAEINPDIKINSIKSPGKTFNDIKEHPNRTAIELLAERDIINGKTPLHFEPQANLTRAEFATIVTRALGLPEKTGATFNDVKEDDWFFSYVNTAYSYGIIKGISEESFNPHGSITRQEAAVMISRAAALCGMKNTFEESDIRNTLAPFGDYKSVSDWAESSLAFCFDKKILDGKATEINPDERISRGEAAQTIYNVLNASGLLGDLKND